MVNLHQFIYAISDALDLVGVDDVNHGKRVAYMALECSKELKTDIDRTKLLHAALLHDCGVSSTNIHDNLVYVLDWDGAKDHCIRGYQLLEQSVQLKHLSNLILYHHTHYDVLQKMEVDEDTLILTNLIFLADRVDALIAQNMKNDEDAQLYTMANNIREEVSSLSGSFFMPELVETFLKVSNKEEFWLTLAPDLLHTHLLQFINELEQWDIDIFSLAEVSKILGNVVDAKSHYTANHSMDVAKLSSFIANKMGMDDETSLKIEIAGLLHDLGKLRIPDELLDKHGPLDDKEFSIVQTHASTTEHILSKVNGLKEISQWTAQHHEKLNGGGYPYHTTKDKISMPARIIAVADIFQALAQKRPYRDNIDPLDILHILKDKVQAGEIESSVVAVVENNLQKCWEISLVNSD